MNREKLAELLGLPKDSPEGKVFEALAKRDAEGRAARESLAAITGQFDGLGLKLDGTSLVRVEPLKLDIVEGDSDEVKSLKAELAKNRAEKELVAATSRRDFITKLAKDLHLPPAYMGLATEVLSVRDEMEALMLSKDGKAVQISKVKDFPAKVEKLLLAIVSLKGSKTATPTEQTDEELAKKEREDLAKSLSAKTGGKAAEVHATK